MERKKLERYLKMYFNGEIKELINNRKQSLIYPPRLSQEEDVKVQSNSRGDSPQEKLITKIESDGLIVYFSQVEQTVQSFLKGCTGTDRRLLELRYKYNSYWSKIELELNFSERHLRRKRDELLNRLEDRFGWLE